MNRSTTLGFIDGPSADQRLELTLVQRQAGNVELVMSEQHFAEGIGWFTQRSLNLDPDQVSQLKRMLQVQDLPKERTSARSTQPEMTLKLHSRSQAEDASPLAEVG
ncbi:hypothetical protein GC170_03790 [bacterium]|nr:hypothetical protein [bacterium]